MSAREATSDGLSPKQQGKQPTAVVEEGRTRAGVITPRSSTDRAPLSFAQQRLWVLHQIEPDSPAYNVPKALRLSGQLEVDALQRSLNAVIGRHEVLRTRFEYDDVDGHARQAVTDEARIDLPVLNLSHLKETEQHNEVLRLAHEQLAEPFDLSQPPLIRAALLRCGDQDHILLLAIHHIVFDGWSVHVFLRELAAFYTAFISNSVAMLQPLAIQYADFACWQRQWLQGKVLENQLNYWKEKLGGTLPMLELPTDHPRPAVQTFNGARQTTLMPEALLAKLKDLSNKHGVTLFMTLLAAFKVLLYRYTAQEDVIVGTPIAGRNLVEIENLIGFFVNTLTMRTDLGGDPPFTELLQRVRGGALEAYDHQDLPFEKLVEEIQPERSLSHSPFFQVMFQLRNLPRKPLQVPDLTIEEFDFDSRIAKFDIDLWMIQSAEGLRAQVVYNTDLFDPATITRMLGHFRTLLEGIVKDPEQRVGQLPLLTCDELRELLDRSGASRQTSGQSLCLHELFQQQVERTPENIAVVFEAERLTYQELNQRANKLAHYLQRQGIGPETLVAICLERTHQMIIAMLGILKAGGAYIPLDPNYPKDRISFILDDSAPPVIVTESTLQERLPAHRAKTICLDLLGNRLAQESESNPEPAARPDNLAYVIYTSGSLGEPKGALITHSNVTRLFEQTWPWFRFDERDVWTLFHSYAFDFSVWEIWGALIYGGRLVLVPHRVSRSPDAFYDLLCKTGVTVLNQTPSAFLQLTQAEELLGVSSDLALRLVIFGGEALYPQSLKPWVDRHGDQRPKLVNMYGITETTVHVTYRPLSLADLGGTSSSIGQSIPDLEVYVLDRYRQLAPVGIPGQVYVGGAGLARGYLNRPELTAEKFIRHPFSDDPQARLYETGDLARYLPAGDMEYLGRIDDQVKLRGFRVELGEIESVLRRQPLVRDCVVTAREDVPGDKRLVAYVVPVAGVALDTNELRVFLQGKLPEYMIPATVVELAELPLTPSGKVNRRALPAPVYDAHLQESYVAPRTPAEELLASIWAQVLKVSRVGIHDNFFELGGHSLLGIQLISRLRDRFQVELPVRILFDAPTVASLAQYLPALLESADVVNRQKLASLLVPVQPSGWRKPLFLLPGEGGEAELLGYSKLAGYIGLDQPTYGVTAPTTPENGIQLDVRGMAARCVRELRSFQPEGPYSLMGYCVGGIIAFEIAQQLKSDNQQVGPLILIDTLYPAGAVPPHLRRADRYLFSHFLNRARIHLKTWSNQTSSQGLGYLFARVKTIGRMLDSRYSAKELARNAGQANYGYLKAVADYRADVYPGKIVLMVTEEIYRKNPTMGWSKLAHGGLEIYQIAGNHLTCIREHAQSTALLVKSCLEIAKR